MTRPKVLPKTLSYLFLNLILLTYSPATANTNLPLNLKTLEIDTTPLISNSRATTSVYWDRLAQRLIRETNAGPTVSSGTFGALHTAIYNAWSLYNPPASPSFRLRIPRRLRSYTNNPSHASAAMSAAAIELLSDMYPSRISEINRAAIHKLTFKGPREALRGSEQIGRSVARRVLQAYKRSRPTDPIEDLYRLYPRSTDIDRWTPERVPIDDPSGHYQTFLSPEWGRLAPFALRSGKDFRPREPYLFLTAPGGDVSVTDRTITLKNGTLLPVTHALIGPVINRKFVRQVKQVLSYSKRLVRDGAFGKVSAEFWEDGAGTSFPPGKWQSFCQFVSVRDRHNEEQDVKTFFMAANALRDAGIATWNAKLFYYYARPVRAVRDLVQLGLIGRGSADATIKSYNIYSRSVTRSPGREFTTYQNPKGDPSPPFAEYVSGHSTFSAAAAEVLKLATGKDKLGAEVTVPKGVSKFEPGFSPPGDKKLRWATFSDAALEAGQSRLWGGIHFNLGNEEGTKLGRKVGKAVYKRAQRLFKGTA